MSLPTRNVSVQSYQNLNSGLLLTESGDVLTTEDGFGLLIDNPTQDPNLTTRNVATLASYPSRN